jgi:hypothetical protein
LAALTVGALSAVPADFSTATILPAPFNFTCLSLAAHHHFFDFSVNNPCEMDEEYNFSVDDAERETIRVWRTWRTVFEMLQDRVRL